MFYQVHSALGSSTFVSAAFYFFPPCFFCSFLAGFFSSFFSSSLTYGIKSVPTNGTKTSGTLKPVSVW